MEELDDVINVPRERLWTYAILFACDVTNKSFSMSTERGKLPYELWFGTGPTPDHFRPFEAAGYAQRSMYEHNMALIGEKYVFVGISRNFPSGTVNVLLVKITNIVERQAVQWVDGPDKTSSGGVGNEDLGTKPDEDESVVKIGSPQLDVQELELVQ